MPTDLKFPSFEELLKKAKQPKGLKITQPASESQTEFDSESATQFGYKLPTGWKLRRVQGESDTLFSPRGFKYQDLIKGADGRLQSIKAFDRNDNPIEFPLPPPPEQPPVEPTQPPTQFTPYGVQQFRAGGGPPGLPTPEPGISPYATKGMALEPGQVEPIPAWKRILGALPGQGLTEKIPGYGLLENIAQYALPSMAVGMIGGEAVKGIKGLKGAKIPSLKTTLKQGVLDWAKTQGDTQAVRDILAERGFRIKNVTDSGFIGDIEEIVGKVPKVPKGAGIPSVPGEAELQAWVGKKPTPKQTELITKLGYDVQFDENGVVTTLTAKVPEVMAPNVNAIKSEALNRIRETIASGEPIGKPRPSIAGMGKEGGKKVTPETENIFARVDALRKQADETWAQASAAPTQAIATRLQAEAKKLEDAWAREAKKIGEVAAKAKAPVAPAPAAPQPMVKQPWQMTRAEYAQREISANPELQAAIDEGFEVPNWGRLHGDIIRKAQQEGRNIPQNVLQEYPSLQPSVGRPSVSIGWSEAAKARPPKTPPEVPAPATPEGLPLVSMKGVNPLTAEEANALNKAFPDLQHWSQGDIVPDYIEKWLKSQGLRQVTPPVEAAEVELSLAEELGELFGYLPSGKKGKVAGPVEPAVPAGQALRQTQEIPKAPDWFFKEIGRDNYGRVTFRGKVLPHTEGEIRNKGNFTDREWVELGYENLVKQGEIPQPTQVKAPQVAPPVKAAPPAPGRPAEAPVPAPAVTPEVQPAPQGIPPVKWPPAPPGAPPFATRGAGITRVPEPPAGIFPPEGPKPGGKGIPQGVTDALFAADAIVRRDAPGLATRVINAIPGLKQTQRFIGNKALGVRKQVMKGFIGLNHTGVMESSQLQARLLPTLGKLENSFGKGSVSGVVDAATYIGSDVERVPFSGKLLDVVERPHLYDLTPEQRTLLTGIQADKSAIQVELKGRYGYELNEFPTPEGAIHVPHSDISKDALARAKARRGQETTITQESTKPRPYATAAERWLHDKALFDQGKITADQVFKPNLNVGELLNADNNLSASLSAYEVFKTSLGGKTKLQLYQELHPGQIPTEKVLNEFNPRGYVYVKGGGLNLYYETQDAEQIIRMVKRSNNPILRFLDNYRATNFGGDLSPATIQGLNAWLMDPVGVSKTLGREIKLAVKERNFFNAYTVDNIAADMRSNPEKWRRITLYTGINPMGGSSILKEEFGGGFLSQIPKVGKYWERFNDAMYRPVTKIMGDGFESTYQAGLKAGLSPEMAGAVAADDVMKLTMRYNYVRLGMSPAEAAHRRALLTSVSFLVQPVALMNDAAKGMLKMGGLQFSRVTPTEAYAIKRVLTLSAIATAASVSTAVLYAKNRGLDTEKAAIKAAMPQNWALTNPANGDRYTIGGPFRAIMKAVAPGDVQGVPVQIPFAGIGRFFQYKVHPGIRLGVDELENKDFYDRNIRTGDFPVNVAQGLEYAAISALPLTPGQVLEGMRTGLPAGTIAKQAAGQFLGTNIGQQNPKDVIVNQMFPGRTYTDLNPRQQGQVRQSTEYQALAATVPQGAEVKEREDFEQDQYTQLQTRSQWVDQGFDDKAQPYNVKNWREDYSAMQEKFATYGDTKERLLGEFKRKSPKTDEGKALVGYYAVIEKFPPDKGGKVDVAGVAEALDDYLAGISPDMEQYVLDSIGVHDDEKALQFRKDKRVILKAYWNPLRLTQQPDKEEKLKTVKILENRGLKKQADEYEEKQGLKGYAMYLNDQETQLRWKDQEIDSLLVKWGYSTAFQHPGNKGYPEKYWKLYTEYYTLPANSYLNMTKTQVDAGRLPEKYRKEWEAYNKYKNDTTKELFREAHKDAAKSDRREVLRRKNKEFDKLLQEIEGLKPLKPLPLPKRTTPSITYPRINFGVGVR